MRRKTIIGIIVANVAFLLAIIVLFALHITKTSTVDILVAPLDAKILINGKEYQNRSAYKMRPGSYDVEISREGFETKHTKLTVEDGTTKLYDYLKDNRSSEGLLSYVYEGNKMANVMLLQEIDAPENRATVSEYMSQLMLIENELPLGYSEEDDWGEWRRFTVLTSTENCYKLACLEITGIMGENNREFAMEYLSSLGFKMNYYTIRYEEMGN